MKRIMYIFAVLLLLAGLGSCASSPSRVSPGSSVWKISKNGNHLFLGGSIHILREQDFPLPKEFDRAFAQSQALVLESDVAQMENNEETAQYLMNQMFLSAGQTLYSILDSDTYELLEAKCGEYGFSTNDVSSFKPSMIVTMLTVLQIQKFGFVQQGVDLYFLNKAHKAQKPVYFLETVETQIDMLSAMGEGYENDFVRYSLHDLSNTDTALADLLAEWTTGASSIMETSLAEMKKEWPEIYHDMITDRNAAWLPLIENHLDSGHIPFIIVGAAHLHGPDGLLLQLENSGYTVEQLR